jgi:pimeloyl-ACP methyl ester carboxylesterase
MTRLAAAEWTIGERILRGTVYFPDGAETPGPAAVLHHGFGSSRTEAFGLFVQLARALAARGHLVVTVDRAGHGESDGSFFDTTLTADIADSAEILRDISGWPEVDSSRIHLVGMSFGSIIASVLAAESGVPVASLTLISPAAVFVDELRSGTLQGRPFDRIEIDGFFDFNSARLGPAFFADARQFDAYGRARGYPGPVRILHGGADHIVPVVYAERYSDVYGTALELTVVPDADHMWSSVLAREPLLDAVTAFVSRTRTRGVT